MVSSIVFEWEGKEYAFEEKGADWYWALGIIATAAIIVSVLFNNILLALVILAGSVTLGLVAAKRPVIHRFAITDSGVAIDNNLYLFRSMRDFSVLEYLDETLPPALSIKTNHILAPHLIVPIVGHDPMDIYEYVSQHLPEGRHHEPTLIEQAAGMFRL